MPASGLCHSPSLPDQYVRNYKRKESRKLQKIGKEKEEKWEDKWGLRNQWKGESRTERKKVKNEVIVTGIYEQFWEKKIKKNDRLISKVE